ncbi:ABC transporter ATP-binding protein [Paraglaciecola sp. L1A13]|uniref:ABC transporter ATP-binding protein n=1 Tax=Paraglaciecola sp. L1A13 TaxID=2686359 RepID=UPI00131B02D0|nr:ABC transporter ATP-binding protein [Paraglaciecola sp. L1A13]
MNNPRSASITVKDVSFRYGPKVALDSINLQVTSGINIILGPNGAGKSTLFSLLTGLLCPSCGAIDVNGLSFDKQHSSIMQSMGVVFQQSTLDLDLTVQQNLLYFASLHGIAPDKALKNIESMLVELALNDRLQDKVRTLNGGHRRRVEIVRALIHQPQVLLLDEPTVGLDIESRALILKHVRALGDRDSLCVLWATHLIDEIRPSDSLVVIHSGKIKAQGVTEPLCQENQVDTVSQLYRKLTGSTEAI